MGLYGDGSQFFFCHFPSCTKNKSPVVKLTTEQHKCGYKNKNRLTEMKRLLGQSSLFRLYTIPRTIMGTMIR